MKMNRYLLISFFMSLIFSLSAQQVTFQLDIRAVDNPTQVGIRGGIAPLSWEKTYPLKDEDGDGIYSTTITFDTNEENIEYKYVYGDLNWELESMGNRSLNLNSIPEEAFTDIWDKTRIPTKAEIEAQKIGMAALQEDFQILKKAYTALHPGLYRYNTPKQLAEHFDALEVELQKDLNLPEAYLAFSKFLGKIKCGHTYANFWNQEGDIRKAIFLQPDKVPFLFDLLEGKMVITQSADDKRLLSKGTIVNSINGVETSTIIDQLLPFVKGDGNKMAKRLSDLQLNGIGKHEFFDVYFPLLFPSKNGTYTLEVMQAGSTEQQEVLVKTMTREERRDIIEKRFGPMIKSTDESWCFKLLDDQTGYLRMGTFAVWQMEMDWKNFLKEAFSTLQDNKVPNLIIDIRGNEGGLDEVSEELSKYILQSDVRIDNMKSRLAYNKVPEEVAPYISTWEKGYLDLSAKVEPAEKGLFKFKEDKDEASVTLKGSKNKLLFKGKIYMLIDAGNSSATFYLARVAKKGQLATLVGETTGGNQRGINGGMMFFLRLPNSKIEMDIPLFASFPFEAKPDAGIDPDIFVERSYEDLLNGIDRPIQTVLSIIHGN